MTTCSHLDQITVLDLPDDIPGCEDCLAMGGQWVHLRVCRSCGKVGCCDSSPNRHASKHAREASHAIMTSVEPGEDWSYCVIDDVATLLWAVNLGSIELHRPSLDDVFLTKTGRSLRES